MKSLLTSARIAHHEAAGEWPVPGVSALLDERVRQSPERLFLIDGDQRLTFGAFAARVEGLAAGLAQLEVAPGDVVSWQLPSWWEGAVIAVALDRVGAISNPILPIYREREVGFIVRQAGTRLLIVPGVFRGFDYRELALSVRRDAPALRDVVVVRDAPGAGMRPFEQLAATAGPALRAARGPHAVASLFYTSGTTADPKGVMHTASTLGAFARNSVAVGGATPDDGSLLQFPLTHIGGIAAFLMVPILMGSRTVYLDVWDPERALALIEREQLSSAGGPPPILQGLLNAPRFDRQRVRTLKVAGTGAADIPPELVRDVRRRLAPISYRSYGLTECPMLTSGTLRDTEGKCATTDGRPTPGCTVRIVDERGAPVAAGVAGDIEAFGPQLCVGYLDARLNADAFTGDGYLRTGDLGVMDAEGYVRVTGRRKDIIIRKGENLSAKAIEDILYEHPAVADVAVIGVPDRQSGERACACIVLRDSAGQLSLDDIRTFMEAKQVMRQTIPEQLELMPVLPRTATGKVMKNELRRMVRGK